MLFFLLGATLADLVTVEIADGIIQGNVEWYDGKRVDEYLGVPFAKPPIDELRFMEPEPVEPWEDVWDATRKQPLC